MLPVIRYRILTDDAGRWFVRWLCGSRWLLVYEAVSEAQAREFLLAAIACVL